MNEHSASSFHDSRAERHNKGDVRIYGIADEDFTGLKVEEVSSACYDPRFSYCQTRPSRLPNQLSWSRPKSAGLFLRLDVVLIWA
jgi:hypothetical protein